MKIMCDTNVIIDVLLEREPFVEDSCQVRHLCEEHKIDGFVSASCITDIYYLVGKYTHSSELAYKAITLLHVIKKISKILTYCCLHLQSWCRCLHKFYVSTIGNITEDAIHMIMMKMLQVG